MPIEELAVIDREISNIKAVLNYLAKRKSRLFYASHRKANTFRESLLAIKTSLFRLKKKVKKLSGEEETVETINDFISNIEDGEKNAERWSNELLVQYVNILKSSFSELKGVLPAEIEFELDIDLSKVPSTIRTDLRRDFDELKSCFLVEAYRGTIMFCGRILETALGRKYFEETGIDPAEQLWTLGKLITECGKANINLEPGVYRIAKLINDMRVPSVHKKARAYLPTPDEARGIILITKSVITRLFGP